MTTTALVARPTGQGSGLFGWVLAGSVAFHGTVAWVLPNVTVLPHALPKSLVVDVVSEPPAPAPPPEPSALPEPRAPEPPPKVAPPAIAATPPAARPTPATPNERETARATEPDDAPADFTSAVLSSDGAGVAVSGGAGGVGRGTGGRADASPARPTPVAPPAPAHAARHVAAGSLAKAPRAPGLDAALERNYPLEARRAGIAGRAMLRIEVLPDGRLGGVKRLSESYPGFGEACEKTVRGARWEPPIDRDGSAVSTEITYTCRFEVRS